VPSASQNHESSNTPIHFMKRRHLTFIAQVISFDGAKHNRRRLHYLLQSLSRLLSMFKLFRVCPADLALVSSNSSRHSRCKAYNVLRMVSGDLALCTIGVAGRQHFGVKSQANCRMEVPNRCDGEKRTHARSAPGQSFRLHLDDGYAAAHSPEGVQTGPLGSPQVNSQ
jgi:hypothetical protein